MWYHIGGHVKVVEIIVRDMTREQIADAQRLSREWLEAHPGGN